MTESDDPLLALIEAHLAEHQRVRDAERQAVTTEQMAWALYHLWIGARCGSRDHIARLERLKELMPSIIPVLERVEEIEQRNQDNRAQKPHDDADANDDAVSPDEQWSREMGEFEQAAIEFRNKIRPRTTSDPPAAAALRASSPKAPMTDHRRLDGPIGNCAH
jgi:hypothetical protein